MKKLFKFLSDIIRAGSEESHKRAIAVASAAALIMLAFLNLFTQLELAPEFIYTLGGLAGLQSALSVVEKFKTKTNEEKKD